MVYFRKYFGKCALTTHFAPQTTPQSPTNDLPTTRSPMLLRPPSPALCLCALAKGKKQPVLVTRLTSTGRSAKQYWLISVTSTGHVGDQYWFASPLLRLVVVAFRYSYTDDRLRLHHPPTTG